MATNEEDECGTINQTSVTQECLNTVLYAQKKGNAERFPLGIMALS